MRFRPEIDYYEVLQVHPRASQQMIKKAYRTLMGEMRGHPDLGGDPEGAKLINEAYTVVGDPNLRRAYDRARAGSDPGRPVAVPGGLDRAGALFNKLLLTALVVGAGMMLARLLENPALSLADLVAMVVVLLRIWNQVALTRGR